MTEFKTIVELLAFAVRVFNVSHSIFKETFLPMSDVVVVVTSISFFTEILTPVVVHLLVLVFAV